METNDTEFYRKFRMMSENVVGSTWVCAKEQAFGRIIAFNVVAWCWVAASLMSGATTSTTVIGPMFAMAALALWTFLDAKAMLSGHNLVESDRPLQDRIFIATMAERLADDLAEDTDE